MNDIPAFPRLGHKVTAPDGRVIGRVVHHEDNGMTLRDYFAAKAMQGLLELSLPEKQTYTNTLIAETAYALADTMMEARNK